MYISFDRMDGLLQYYKSSVTVSLQGWFDGPRLARLYKWCAHRKFRRLITSRVAIRNGRPDLGAQNEKVQGRGTRAVLWTSRWIGNTALLKETLKGCAATLSAALSKHNPEDTCDTLLVS